MTGERDCVNMLRCLAVSRPGTSSAMEVNTHCHSQQCIIICCLFNANPYGKVFFIFFFCFFSPPPFFCNFHPPRAGFMDFCSVRTAFLLAFALSFFLSFLSYFFSSRFLKQQLGVDVGFVFAMYFCQHPPPHTG